MKKSAIILLILILFSATSFSHEGHNEGDPAFLDTSTSERVIISESTKKNLNLKLGEVVERKIDKVLLAFGKVKPVPSLSHQVTTRFNGRIHKIYVNVGDTVKKGQVLATVESSQIGDPPPRVKLRSPIAGVITEQHAFPGEFVAPNDVHFVVTDISIVYVKTQIYEPDIGKVRKWQRSRLRVSSYPLRNFKGTVKLVGKKVDSETRTIPVWVSVSNPDQLLLPEMQTEIAIVIKSNRHAIAIKKEAVLGGFGNYFVFLEEDQNTFVRTPIVTGINDDIYVEVKHGLLPGDIVAIQGHYQLQFVKSEEEEETEIHD